MKHLWDCANEQIILSRIFAYCFTKDIASQGLTQYFTQLFKTFSRPNEIYKI